LAEAPEPPNEGVAGSASPIINGSLDTTTKAAVWLLDESQGGSCTGTIVKVDGNTGYVLTAAHCSSIDYVIVANDYQDCFGQGDPGCEAVFQVTQQIYHPNWTGDAGNGYDYSMIRFSGANGFPYVIPPAKSLDTLSDGDMLDIVGYGQTESGNNSRRRHKVTPLQDIQGGLLWHFSTVCFGDSGGPAIFQGKVVGVSSFVLDGGGADCTDYGASGRVSDVYDWIESFTGPIGETTSASSSASGGPGATTGAGMGGFGEGGFAGEGAAPTQLGPDDDYEWFPGKQDDQDEDGDASSCSATPAGLADASRGGGSLALLLGLALLGQRAGRRRRGLVR